MFAPTAYLRWARRFYGRVAFDLATSGMLPAPMRELRAEPLGDTDAWDPLREKIARYNGVPFDEVLPTMGTTHALWTAYTSLLAPGDEAIVERPTYEPMYRIPEGLGARVTWFERPASERFALDPDRVAAAMSPRTRVVALTNLHNPGGVRTSDETLSAIARIADAYGAHVLVDEVYAPFDAACDASGTWTGGARNLAPNIVVTSSLTKVYGLGSLRVGWMIGPREIVSRGEDALLSNLGHAPFAWSELGVAAFDALPSLALRARSLLGTKRTRVEAWAASRSHLEWSAPNEGLFGFALDRRGGDLREAIERAAIESGVLVAAGSFFGIPNGFRLSWSIDSTRLDEGLERLGRALP